MGLNLFPVRVPIGRATGADGRSVDVLMTVEFARALADVFARIGGANGMGVDDLVNIIGSQNEYGALVSAALGNVADLSAMLGQVPALQSRIGVLEQAIRDMEKLISMPTSVPIDWERPGKIGARRANTGAFTALQAQTLEAQTCTATSTTSQYGFSHLPGVSSGGKFYAGMLVGNAVAANASGCYGYIYDPVTPAASFFHLTPYGSGEGTKFKVDTLGNLTTAAGFGCNGKTAQAAKASGGTLAGVISALVANGILAS